jgi:SpoVK/Ycf46/Vps4 family AAA+-type ATPase
LQDDDEDEYQEPSNDDESEDFDDEDDDLHSNFNERDFIESDSEEDTDSYRRKKKSRSRPQQRRTQTRRTRLRNSTRRSQRGSAFDDDDADFDNNHPLTLEDELAELKENASSDPPRKHLRARKEINYQILPPPSLDEPLDLVVQEPRPKLGPIKQLFKTSGPFGGAETESIFGNTGPNALKAAGGVLDSDSSDDDLKPAPGSNITGATVKGKKSQLADSDPLGIDTNIDFSVVGGLDSFIEQLKEMVTLPLKYPEIYQRFGVTPPRGVLFHGPPGTGKTLMARALAASCSSEGKKVTFFMRKGADCLSKWVGEAERQLRLLFEEAKNQQPSIIFFDEIDGLAPVRSSKQEQIHASIVSTLLALMDGMDNRGQVIVIGATNRPDSVDSALRRPGRFDREFYFPLPDLEARKKILSIHTRKWDPPLKDTFIEHIARVTKGYGGADLRALCTEAALAAIQRRYPQIYSSKDKLLIDPSTIHVTARDFMKSVDKIIPSSARSTASNAAPLPTHVEPLLNETLQDLKAKVDNYIPRKKNITPLEEALLEDFNDKDGGFKRLEATREFQTSRVFRPRLLVHGASGMGQQYLGAAILHHLEGYHIQSFDLGTLLSDSTKTPEAMMVQLLVEVKRHTPSVIYIPNIDSWFATMSPTAKSTFVSFLRNLKPTDSILVLALMENEDLFNSQVNSIFGYSGENVVGIKKPSSEARKKFFKLLIKYIKSKPTDFPDPATRKKRQLEVLPIAPIEEKSPTTEHELKQRKRKNMQTRNKLKIKLSAIMEPLKTRYKKFKKPIIDPVLLYHLFDTSIPVPAQQPAYTKTDDDMINETSTGRKYYNMDLDVIEERLWNGYYSEPKQFLADVRKIYKDSQTSQDRDRLMKSSEMMTNTQVYIDEISADTQFLLECQNLRKEELEEAKESERKAKEEMAAKGIEEKEVIPLTGDTIVTDEVSPFFANGKASLTLVEEDKLKEAFSTEETRNEVISPNIEPVVSSDQKEDKDTSPESEPELQLSSKQLATFYERLVDMTQDLTIERLEQVNSALIDVVWSRRHEWNRNHIIVALDQKLTAVLAAIRESAAVLRSIRELEQQHQQLQLEDFHRS